MFKYISYAFVEHERTLKNHAIIVYELPSTTSDVSCISKMQNSKIERNKCIREIYKYCVGTLLFFSPKVYF